MGRAITGATAPGIAAATGHLLKDIETLLDALYLGRDIPLAEAAEARSEAKP